MPHEQSGGSLAAQLALALLGDATLAELRFAELVIEEYTARGKARSETKSRLWQRPGHAKLHNAAKKEREELVR